MHEVLNKYGIRQGEVVHIDDVESGLACGTFCTSCKSPFVAKKGDTQHHFAHHNHPNCGKSFESALHLLAKKIINDSSYIKVPSDFGGKILAIESCELEKKVSNIRPDILIKLEDGSSVFVEITVTSKVSKEKIKLFKRIGTPVFEITFFKEDGLKSLSDIKYLVIEEITNKQWIISPDGFRKKLHVPRPIIPIGFFPQWSKYYNKQNTLHTKLTIEYFEINKKWQEQKDFEKQLSEILEEERKLIIQSLKMAPDLNDTNYIEYLKNFKK